MKLSELKNKLNNNQSINGKRISSVKKEYLDRKKLNNEIKNTEYDMVRYKKSSGLSMLNNVNEENKDEFNLDNVKVVGVTGSKGKSTVCYLVHKYLKLKGKKSILYSSIEVDSKASVKKKAPLERSISSLNTVLDVLEEAEYYNSDYIILEVNESAIEEGFVKDIPFSVRALTNIIPDCNLERYSEEEYLNLKKSFFKDVNSNDTGKCVVGLTGYFDRLKFNEFLRLNSLEKITYSGKNVCERNNADYTNVDILHYNENYSLKRTNFNLRVKNSVYTFASNFFVPHMTDNIACVVGILEALGEFDSNVFQTLLNNITIPGREEVIIANGRTIVIGVFLVPILSVLNKYKKQGEFKKLKVVCGMPGIGFQTWDEHLSSERRVGLIDYIHRDAMKCVKANADYVYLTSNDPAALNPMDICLNLEKHINNEISSCIEVDRKKAIEKAIRQSNIGDVIYIAGRGNRRLFCKTKDKMEIFSDKEIVLDVIGKLGW